MSGKYSDNKFFFAHYGCCIPTEAYAWILLVMFITSVIVLLFCILATATVRWMYKRRMRKRLHDLKKKYLQDQVKAQEFEAKLNYMAQRNKIQNHAETGSKEKSEKLTIFVDPTQNCAKQKIKKNTSVQAAPTTAAPPVYDPDATPIAHSSLASQSNSNIPGAIRWTAEPPPKKASYFPPPPPPQITIPTNESLQRLFPDPTPTPPESTRSVPPVKSPVKKPSLAPPSAPITTALTSSPMTTPVATASSIKGNEGGLLGSNVPTSGSTFSTTTTGPSPATVSLSTTTNDVPSSFVSAPKHVAKPVVPQPADDDFKLPRVEYGMDDIVSPRVSERKDAAGGKNEWKYYYADSNAGSDKKWRHPLSTTSRSMVSHRQSTKSWLYDSTGTNRFESGKEQNSSLSSSIIKTDSSHYKTASIEKFPHGAFDFQ